jgi:hypothetical protein
MLKTEQRVSMYLQTALLKGFQPGRFPEAATSWHFSIVANSNFAAETRIASTSNRPKTRFAALSISLGSGSVERSSSIAAFSLTSSFFIGLSL